MSSCMCLPRFPSRMAPFLAADLLLLLIAMAHGKRLRPVLGGVSPVMLRHPQTASGTLRHPPPPSFASLPRMPTTGRSTTGSSRRSSFPAVAAGLAARLALPQQHGEAPDSSGNARDQEVPKRGVPAPLFSAPMRRLELEGAQYVGAGYDLVDVRIFTATGEPLTTTFMLDSGLSTNLVSESLFSQLELAEVSRSEAVAVDGVQSGMRITKLLGIQLLGNGEADEVRFEGVWSGDGWRALCSLDWNGFMSKANNADGSVEDGKVIWTVLPTSNMTEEQMKGLVGFTGTEFVGGQMDASRSSFVGRGMSVEPKGVLATTKRYEIVKEGADLIVKTEAVDGLRLRPVPTRPSVPLPGPMSAACTPFTQEDIARREGVTLGGMLGQFPLHRVCTLDIDPIQRRLSLYQASAASEVAEALSFLRLPGQDLRSGLLGVSLGHAPLLHKERKPADIVDFVQAIVDTGSANTILNWPAAEKLLGIRQDDKLVKESPTIRIVGVSGGSVDMPLITLSIGLLAGRFNDRLEGRQKIIRPTPIRVAIGDAPIFDEIFGREEQGTWMFGLGPQPMKPGAVLGQDILSQSRYIMSASEPALYMPSVQENTVGEFAFVGEGDCLDSDGRRLRGLQKLGTTPDEAAAACLSLKVGSCRGIAVTPLGEKEFQGLCYIFVDDEESTSLLEDQGWKKYAAPDGQSLAPAGASVASANGDKRAECYSWRPAS